MKINKPSFSKKAIIITITVILVMAMGYGAYAMTSKHWPFATKESSSIATTEDPNTTDTTTTPENITPSPSDTSTKSPKTPVANEDPDTVPKNEVSVTLTSITMSGDSIRVKSLIEAVTNQGTCTLTLTKDSSIITKTSGIQAMPNSSTCKGFTIPKNELPTGVWHVKLSVVTGEKTGSASQDYRVQ